MATNIFSSVANKFKAQFVPVRDTKLGIYLPTGAIAKAVKPADKYEEVSEYRVFIDGELTTVPAALVTTNVPVYRISKPVAQVKPGDIIRTGDDKKYTYRMVTKVEGDKITSNSFGGKTGNTTVAIKDLFLDSKTVSVAVNLMQGVQLQGEASPLANPMMLALLNDGDDDNCLQTMMMLQMFGQGGNTQNNLLPLLLMSDGEIDTKTLLLMQATQGQGNIQSMLPYLLMGRGGNKDELLMMAMMGANNPFAALFQQPVVAAETPATED